jgi:hypothetical protein
MKFSLLFFSMLFCFLSSLTNAADADMKIYRWIDEQGLTHFSDTAIPGTQEVSLKDYNLLTTDKKKNTSVTNEVLLEDKNTDNTSIKYKATILSPTDDQALRSNDGAINVHVSTEPEKNNTQTLQLYLDGKKLGSPQISPTFRALNIDRGTHQVQVMLLDENGKSLAKTQIVTVHVLRITK